MWIMNLIHMRFCTKGEPETMMFFKEKNEPAASLGFGMMRLPHRADGIIDQEEVNRMVDFYMATPGEHHFDTAFMYDGGASEAAFRMAVADRYPRSSYTLTTKLVAWMACEDEESAKAEFETSLERTGAGYFDEYLMHAVRLDNYQKYEEYHLWDYAQNLKQEGKIRHYGMSFHATPELLDVLLTQHPGMDTVQLQINYADWDSVEVQARRNYETARKHGVSITAMSPARGGALVHPPKAIREVLDMGSAPEPYVKWALRFAASLKGVSRVLTGVSSEAELRENVMLMQDRTVLEEMDQTIVLRAIETLKSMEHIPCTMCHACDASCPQKVAIPEIFSAMNEVLLFEARKSAQGLYGRVTDGKGKGKASLCIDCKRCEPMCPENIPITTWLQQAAQIFETDRAL